MNNLSQRRRAVFLDRDGVLIDDVGLVTRREQMRILPGVPRALVELRSAGFRLFVVTNQPVVARGLASEDEVARLHRTLDSHFRQLGAAIDAWFFCPHHPQADLPQYRAACDCRKPGPGMLQSAAALHQISLADSFLVGDRLTDIAAGAAAGCRTAWVQTGKHAEPLIQTQRPLPTDLRADHVCDTLTAAADWILSTALSPTKAA